MSSARDPNFIRVKAYLQTPEAQKHIQEIRQRVRSEATVPIGGVRDLFNFGENQLRGWENLGLLQPTRQPNGGQRRYPFTELDKLSIIRVLIDAGFSPGEIPKDIVAMWKSVVAETRQAKYKPEQVPIDERISNYESELFWRNFIPSILRLLLTLVCEENSISTIGLIMPLGGSKNAITIGGPDELHKLGESLVGWLKEKSLCYTAIEPVPSFRFPTDFMAHQLQVEDDVVGLTFILPRGIKHFHIGVPTREVMQPLLLLLKRHIEIWYPFFTEGMIGFFNLVRDFSQPLQNYDITLKNLTELIVELGGQMPDGITRWRFSCITLPNDAKLPILLRNITVQAQSNNGPHKVGETTLDPDLNNLIRSASLQALHSGRVIYRPIIGDEDPIAFKRAAEGNVRSALALPVGAESGSALAVIYVASEYENAFSMNDQRLLRIMGRVVEEVIATYHIRQQVYTGLSDLVSNPLIVDPSFRDLLSSNDFVHEVETLLSAIQEHATTKESHNERDVFLQKEVSFVAVDVDNMKDIASKYGDAILKNFTKAVYDRINGYIRPFFAKDRASFKLFYVYGSRFYFILYDTSTERVTEYIRQLRNSLQSDYNVGLRRDLIGHPSQPSLPKVTVTIAVTSFSYELLRNVLHDYSHFANPLVEARARINLGIDTSLKYGSELGGDKIIQWDYTSGSFDIKVLHNT